MDFRNFMDSLESDINRRLSDSTDDIDSDWIFCPECGSRNEKSDAFCCECGSALSMDDCSPRTDFTESDFNGIILTDIKRLDEKYSCGRDKIAEALAEFINDSKSHGKEWALLDVSSESGINQNSDWTVYSKVLDDFMQRTGIVRSPRLSLFIIGGHDVVPHPTKANPSGENDEYSGTLFSDFLYSFSEEMPLEFLDYNKARCNVARLPLETGRLNTTFENDIQNYLTRSCECMDEGGISIGRAVMTSNADWIPASREMSRNLPTPRCQDVEGETLDNMFISPGVKVSMPDNLARKYYGAIGSADMLVFNLHGSSEPDDSGFFSSELAFDIESLKHSSARIFNTVACWGARYVRYERPQSMLLNAIYDNNVLIYSGACVPALGKCGHFRQDETWRIQPAAYSETFMARFSEYLCIGKLNCGEAFLKAKCDYYNSSRLVEDDEYILSTVLMFNLYGNPALTTHPDIDALTEIQEPSGVKEVRMPFRQMKKKTVFSKSRASEEMSVYDMIRSAVDNNLRKIHDVVTEKLYRALGLEPRQLSVVEKYETTDNYGGQVRGYIFNYDLAEKNYMSRIIAKTDENGDILSMLQTK